MWFVQARAAARAFLRAREAGRLEHAFAEDFGGEGFQRGLALPGVRGQPGLAAGLLQEGLEVPAVLGGHLWQQQAATVSLGDEQPVFAQFDFPGFDGKERGKNADGNLQPRGLFAGDRKKAHVLESSGARGFNHRLKERGYRKDVADTAADLALQVKGGKTAAVLLQMFGDDGERQFALLQGGINGLMSQAEKQLAFFRRILAQGGGGRWLGRRRALA